MEEGMQDIMFPIGTIMDFDGDVLPDGWLWCDGSPIPEDCIELKQILPTDTLPSNEGWNLQKWRTYIIKAHGA